MVATLEEPDWLSTAEAAQCLRVEARSLHGLDTSPIRKKRGRGKRRGGPDGYLWWREDVQQWAAIRTMAHLSLCASLRVMDAIGRSEEGETE